MKVGGVSESPTPDLANLWEEVIAIRRPTKSGEEGEKGEKGEETAAA